MQWDFYRPYEFVIISTSGSGCCYGIHDELSQAFGIFHFVNFSQPLTKILIGHKIPDVHMQYFFATVKMSKCNLITHSVEITDTEIYSHTFFVKATTRCNKEGNKDLISWNIFSLKVICCFSKLSKSA